VFAEKIEQNEANKQGIDSKKAARISPAALWFLEL
jgi:hypothetical protein